MGILFGGPLAILIVSAFSPEMVAGDGPEAVWRGMATCAGSWIGGGANQAAMKEVFEVGDRIFSAMITVDVLVANVWMAGLLIIAGKSRQLDSWLKADTSAIDTLKERISAYQEETLRIPKTADTLMVLAVGFAVTALSHFLSGKISAGCEELAVTSPWIKDFNLTSTFFWLVVLATTGGVLLSFTRYRNLEGVGASRIATVFLYLLLSLIHI